MDTGRILSRGVAEAIVKEHLERELHSGRKLRVKFGIDPTAPDLHLGHTVPLRKLRQFQDAGHQVVLIIGDFTATIGDPSGKMEARKPLTEKEVKQNLKSYLKQAGKVLNMRKVEVKYNAKWYKKNPSLLLDLMRRESVQRVLERDDFQKRMQEGREITVLEEIYPLLQGYDSVAVKADVEIGGTDQKFNLLMGRKLQRSFNVPEQDVITLPLLEGTDGVKKMSKSTGNYISLDELPSDMFGKIMAVPDTLINKYYELLTDEERKINDPREAKLELGRIIVSMYHGAKAGHKAQDEFIRVFSQGKAPSEISVKKVSHWTIVDLLVEAEAAASKSEARRLVEQGGVSVNDQKITDVSTAVSPGAVIKAGKHTFFRAEQK